MENDDFIVINIHNHYSARMKAKLIKKEVMNKTLSSSDVQPLRVLSDITAEVQRQDFAAVCFTRHTTCQRIKGSRQGSTSSTALSSIMRSSRKKQTFSMLLLVSRTGTYIHVLNVEYLADKFDSFLRILHALYTEIYGEREKRV